MRKFSRRDYRQLDMANTGRPPQTILPKEERKTGGSISSSSAWPRKSSNRPKVRRNPRINEERMAIIWQRQPVTTLGSSAQDTADILVGRQPICGTTKKTVGYELLFREQQGAGAVKPSPEKATAQVV